jgi:catechol 1,2-dioxygenase
MSDEKRNEGLLVTDILGFETLVDEITYKLASDAKDGPTATAVLGPVSPAMLVGTSRKYAADAK